MLVMVLDLVSVTSTTGPALRPVQYEETAKLPDEVGHGDNKKEVASQNAMACGGYFFTSVSRSVARVLSQSKPGESRTSASGRGDWSYSTYLSSRARRWGEGFTPSIPTSRAICSGNRAGVIREICGSAPRADATNNFVHLAVIRQSHSPMRDEFGRGDKRE